MSIADNPYDPAAVKPKARESIHKTILDWFGQRERGKVLDVPAGYGHLSLKLKEMGFEVTCGEIEPEIFKVPDLNCVYTDLSEKIDAPDSSFDYTCCVDGLEHVANPFRAAEEIARVLKPGGYAIFSIPNYANIEKRLKFLWHGYLTKPVSREKFERHGKKLFNLHIFSITVTLLDFILGINNLEVVEIKENAPKKKQYILLPLVLLLKLVDSFSSDHRKKKHRTDLTLHRKVILGGNNLILITRKKQGVT